MNDNLLQSAGWHARFIAQESWTRPLRQHIYSKLNLPKSPMVLEVGSGTGAIISKTPALNAKFYGIDLNFTHLRFCQREFPEIMLNCGDGLSLPFAENVFDVVFCHYLLLWVEDPIRIVREMVRVARAGGTVIIFAEPDYKGRIDYPSALEGLGKAQAKALQLQGADPAIGRKLKAIAHQADLRNYESGILGNESTQSFALPYWESEWQMYEHDLGEIFSEEELAHYKEVDLEAYDLGVRTQFVPTFYLWAIKD